MFPNVATNSQHRKPPRNREFLPLQETRSKLTGDPFIDGLLRTVAKIKCPKERDKALGRVVLIAEAADQLKV